MIINSLLIIFMILDTAHLSEKERLKEGGTCYNQHFKSPVHPFSEETPVENLRAVS